MKRVIRGRKTLLVAVAAVAAVSVASVAFAATVTCTGGPCSGTFAADHITGSPNDDQINAGGGADTVDATQGGNDTVTGGLGSDSINLGGFENSGAGEDTAFGNAGADTIFGDEDTDADSDGDVFHGGLGNDTLTSLDTTDSATLNGEGGGDKLNAADYVVPGIAGDTLNGGSGIDVCTGDSDDVYIGCETVNDEGPS